jgi:hypothetical protein
MKKLFLLNKDKHMRTATLVDKCNKYFRNHSVRIKRIDSTKFETEDLFGEIKDWCKKN